MAKNLANAGYSLSVFDPSPVACAEAVKCPAVSIATSPASVAQQSPVIFTCLPSAEAVRQVYTGANGFIQAGQSGIVTCDHSTMSPEVSRALAKDMIVADIHFLEAPIFGIPIQAHEADVYFAVAGEEAHVGTISPFLEVMGRGYRYVGETGVAHTMKILQNGLGMGHAVLTAEIIVICERLGLDTGSFIDLVKEARALGLSVFFERYATALVSGEKTNAGLVPVCAKDTSLARRLAHEVDLPAPILEEAAAVFQEAMDRGWAEEELTVATRIARGRKGNMYIE